MENTNPIPYKAQTGYRFGHWFNDTDKIIDLLPSLELGVLGKPKKGLALRFSWLGVYFFIYYRYEQK